MGIAEVIPGISGSTIAILLGIYDDFLLLLHSISDFVKEILKFLLGKSSTKKLKKVFYKIKFLFALPLLLGMLTSILLISKLITNVLEIYPEYLYAVLFGLIIPCIFVLYQNRNDEFRTTDYLVMLITSIFFIYIFGLSSGSTNSNLLILFLGGILGISAMILPGISGSFILLIMGVYTYIIGLIDKLTDLTITIDEIFNLSVFALGIVVGFTTFVRLVKFLFINYKNLTLSFLIGLVIASGRVLWPFVSSSLDKEQDEIIIIYKSITEFSLLEVVSLISITVITSAVIIFLQNKYSSNNKIDLKTE